MNIITYVDQQKIYFNYLCLNEVSIHIFPFTIMYEVIFSDNTLAQFSNYSEAYKNMICMNF